MANEMPNMGIKFCTSLDCSEGGSRPALIWSNVERFAIMRKCVVCGLDLLEKLPKATTNFSGVKRGACNFDLDVESEQSVTKRSRPTVTPIPTGPRATTQTTPTDSPSIAKAHLRLDHGSVSSSTTGTNTMTAFQNDHPFDAPHYHPARSACPQVEAPRQSQPTPDNRDQKWCFNCNWNGHSTNNCIGDSGVVREPLMVELHWRDFYCKTEISDLCRKPKEVLKLMDHLEKQQAILSGTKQFFSKRDALFQDMLRNKALVNELDPILRNGETSRGVYEAHIAMANNDTKSFVVSIANATFQIIRTVLIRDRVKPLGESAVQFRTRLTREVYHHPERFPVTEVALWTLVTALEAAWSRYVDRMDELESKYQSRYYAGEKLSSVTHSIIRLPTSSFRLSVRRDFRGEVLWFPLFEIPTVKSFSEYVPEDAEVKQEVLYKSVELEDGEVADDDAVIKKEDPL